MQEPIRYYITKSGEEPTVRSVKVALNTADPEHSIEQGVPLEESQASTRREQDPKHGVRRLVRGAIEKRSRRR